MSSASMKSLSEAVGFHQCGDLHQAETMYRQIIADEPEQADAVNLLGVLCGQTGRLDEAADLLTRACEMSPLTASIRYNLGNVMRELDRPDEAIEAYQLAIELDSSHVSAIHNLGASLLEEGRATEATTCFDRALQLYPQHPTAFGNLIDALQAMATEEAATRLTTMLDSRPDDVDVLHALGVVRSTLEQHRDAAECWEKATALEPGCPDHWHNRGHAMQCAGDYDEAMKSYERAIAIDVEVEMTWSGLITCLRRAGELDAALDACRRALTPFPHSTVIRDALLFVLADLSQHDHAIELCLQALDRDPDDAGACQMGAGLLNAVGRRLEAIGLLERLVELRPNDLDAVSQLATACLTTGHADRAKTLLDQVLSQDPGHVEALLTRADLHRASGEYDDAAAIVARLREQDPTNLNVLISDVADARREGRQAALASQLKSVLADDGAIGGTEQARRALFAIGALHDDLGEARDAMSAYHDANRLKDRGFDVEACGQSVRHVIEMFSDDVTTALPRAAVTDGVRPVFIGGLPRSGTTLVEQILSSHPDIGAAGERTLIPRLLNQAICAMPGAPSYPSGLASLTTEALDQAAASGRAELGEFAEERSVVTEKSTNNSMFAGPISMLFPDARLIICDRDLMDTGLSIYQHEFAGHFPWAYDLEAIGRYARIHDHLVEHWISTSPLHIFVLKYEDLVANTEATIRQLLEFVGVPWNDACMEFHRNERRVRTASREQVRQPIFTTSTGKAQRYEGYLDTLRAGLDAPLPSALR